MVLDRERETWHHKVFADLPDLLRTGDVLVRNNTKVLPARLLGHRESTGGKWEGLYLTTQPNGAWEVLATTRGRPVEGETILLQTGLRLQLEHKEKAGRWIVRPQSAEGAVTLLEKHGSVPLPPYIRKGQEGPGDREHYQTLFASIPGAVAAPTAGLHFTTSLLDRLAARQIPSVDVTLHVGIGTFRPIEASSIEEHVLHAEWAELTPHAAEFLNQARAASRRIVAVGTTSARTLETSAQGGSFSPFSGETALYLRPGHIFRGVDALITNFHLPRSSLLVLVSAFASVEFVRAAYAEAVRQRYRFYSYGDAMLIL
jgi:S-adenosylmethionine:tRNA ribosyltransferase-isomerase